MVRDAAVKLHDCTADGKCLIRQPKVVIGGNGISGQAFVDNIAFRNYARKAFDADVVDMESASVAHTFDGVGRRGQSKPC
jgi:adenosylhomocysteine nucleosidase